MYQTTSVFSHEHQIGASLLTRTALSSCSEEVFLQGLLRGTPWMKCSKRLRRWYFSVSSPFSAARSSHLIFGDVIVLPSLVPMVLTLRVPITQSSVTMPTLHSVTNLLPIYLAVGRQHFTAFQSPLFPRFPRQPPPSTIHLPGVCKALGSIPNIIKK